MVFLPFISPCLLCHCNGRQQKHMKIKTDKKTETETETRWDFHNFLKMDQKANGYKLA